MTTSDEARSLLRDLVEVAKSRDATGVAAAAAQLLEWDGQDWLRMDSLARGQGWHFSIVGGGGKWVGSALSEPTGFVAAMASMHADGHIRQRAVRALAVRPGRVQAAALAVRCMDHVAEVRAQALSGLLQRVSDEDAPVVVSVLVAGATRPKASAPLAAYTEELLRVGGRESINALRANGDRATRRWAFDTSLACNLLGVEDVLAAADLEPDQLIRSRCGAWLGSAAEPHHLVHLLDSRHVELRLEALRHVPQKHLSDARLLALLVDPADRVRRTAQWRARERVLDPAPAYRSALSSSAPRVIAASLAGLADVGVPADVAFVEPFTAAESPTMRAAAAAAVSALAPADEVVTLLAPMLLDSSPKVARAAARALARAGAPASVASAAWESSATGSRRAAWRVQRSSGAWSRVEADLRACGDSDDQLSADGGAGIRNWLLDGAASTWITSERDTARLADLLERSGLAHELRRQVAFHAGLSTETYANLHVRDETAPVEAQAMSPPVTSHTLRERATRAWTRRGG